MALIVGLDHFVLTTKNLQKCLEFYRDILEMKVENNNGRYAIYFGRQKINLHQRPAEFLPAAKLPTSGSLDLCFETNYSIEKLQDIFERKNVSVELGPVARYGARGFMQSVYLRDPDGNLVETCSYPQQ